MVNRRWSTIQDGSLIESNSERRESRSSNGILAFRPRDPVARRSAVDGYRHCTAAAVYSENGQVNQSRHLETQ